MPDHTRADEVEDLALRMSLPNRGVSEWRHEAIGALRAYAALLREDRKQYPYQDGDVMVLGPEVFADGAVVCWQGVNYYREEEPDRCAPLVEAIEGALDYLTKEKWVHADMYLRAALRAHREGQGDA